MTWVLNSSNKFNLVDLKVTLNSIDQELQHRAANYEHHDKPTSTLKMKQFRLWEGERGDPWIGHWGGSGDWLGHWGDVYSAALYHSLLFYNSHQLTYYWAHVEHGHWSTGVMQASRHHVMRASRDVVNYAKQCSSLVSLSRSPSPHHPPLRPRHHVSIPGQHILHVTCICQSCYIYFSKMLHASVKLVHVHHPINPHWGLVTMSESQGSTFKQKLLSVPPFLAFNPLKTTRERLSSLSDSLHTLTGTLFVWLFNIIWEY